MYVSYAQPDGSFTSATLKVKNFGYAQGWRVGMHPRQLADLNGNGLKSASQILGTATSDADSNAVLHLGGGIEIVLIGVHAADLKADMIHLN